MKNYQDASFSVEFKATLAWKYFFLSPFVFAYCEP